MQNSREKWRETDPPSTDLLLLMVVAARAGPALGQEPGA